MKESRFLHIWLHTLMLCSPYELCGEGYRVATNLKISNLWEDHVQRE